jgi:hypothetical protein
MRPPRAAFELFVLLFALAAVSSAANQASCTFNTFPAPQGYVYAQVNDVTDDGTVVGQLEDGKSGAFVAFSHSADGKFTIWDAPNSIFTWFSSRSISGVNVGSYLDNARIQHIHGFAQSGKNYVNVDYPKATHTWVYGINTAGAVVGAFSTNNVVKGFKLINGKYTLIKYPGALGTTPQAINDNNLVVGSYNDGAVYHGFSWKGANSYTSIDYPKSRFGTVMTDVNNFGQIVGNRLSADKTFGFIYQNGAFWSIVYPGAKYAMAGGINNSGVISGEIVFSATNTLAYTAVCK